MGRPVGRMVDRTGAHGLGALYQGVPELQTGDAREVCRSGTHPLRSVELSYLSLLWCQKNVERIIQVNLL